MISWIGWALIEGLRSFVVLLFFFKALLCVFRILLLYFETPSVVPFLIYHILPIKKKPCVQWFNYIEERYRQQNR